MGNYNDGPKLQDIYGELTYPAITIPPATPHDRADVYMLLHSATTRAHPAKMGLTP